MSLRLLKSTATVGGFTLVSRVLGYLRDLTFAWVFGAHGGTDAFFVAFKIPNFLRRLFAEGAFSQAFVPVLSEYRSQRSREEVRHLISRTVGTLGGVLFALSLAAVLGAPLLVTLFAPGFLDDPERFGLTTEMLRLTFPYLFFISLTALAGGVFNTYGRFAVPAFTPVWLNLCLIGAALGLAPQLQPQESALAWGVLLAGVIQLGFQIPFLARMHLLAVPRWGWRDPGVRRILRLMLPALFGSSVAQINLLFDTLIASFLAVGSVSWLYYSDRLVEFPLGVFGIAMATVILPSLSQRHAEADPTRFSATLDWALRWVLLIGVPAALGLILLAEPLIAALYQYGAFAQQDVRMAALALMAYGLGLPAFILVKVLAPGFYARQNTRTPVRIGVIAMLANMAMNVVFVVPLALIGWEAPHAGLALATALAAYVNAGLLYRGLRRESVLQPEAGWGGFALRITLALLAMAGWLYLFLEAPAWWLAATAGERALRLGLLIGGAVAVYFVTLRLCGMRPAQLLARRSGL